MAQIKENCVCMPGMQKEMISHALNLEIKNRERLLKVLTRPRLIEMEKEDIEKVKKVKKEIDELDYC